MCRDSLKDKKSKLNSQNVVIFIGFMICMIVMGASDSMRGVFGRVFQEHFSLTTTQVSTIVTVSYIGNLVFLLLGGNILDRFEKKKVFLSVVGLWMCVATVFVATDNYMMLLVGMFLCMGASTLINTTINLLVPLVFIGAPSLIVNILFFTQGIGTSTSQNLVRRYAKDISGWHLVNVILMVIIAIGIVAVCFSKLPDPKIEKQQVSYHRIIKHPAFLYLILIFGFYFIAEYGILNWFLVYCTSELGMNNENAAVYLSMFFGGMTIGRLVFAPVVQKLGVLRSIMLFGGVSTVIYSIGIAGGKHTVALLSMKGCMLSIVYPTLVLMIQKYYEKDCIATATGVIISIATIFDIVFNMLFDVITDVMGIRFAFYVLLVSMIMFYIVFLCFRRNVIPGKVIDML